MFYDFYDYVILGKLNIEKLNIIYYNISAITLELRAILINEIMFLTFKTKTFPS